MVFYFTSNVVTPPVTLFMGKDKFENEELIAWGFPEDVWFHVDNLSSAHVYLRLEKGQTVDDIAKEVITDACQLVKANSITGNKMNNIDVVYTPWDNLKKTPGMEVGQVAFFKSDKVKKVNVEKRINDIVNRLNKTKREEYPDFRQMKEERDAEERQEKKRLLKKQEEQEKEATKQRAKEAELRSYKSLQTSEKMKTNYDDGNDSDDFM